MEDKVGETQLHPVVHGPRLLPTLSPHLWEPENYPLDALPLAGRQVERQSLGKALMLLTPSAWRWQITSAQILLARLGHMIPCRCKGSWEMFSVWNRWRGDRFGKYLASLHEESGRVPHIIRAFDTLQTHPPWWCPCGSASADSGADSLWGWLVLHCLQSHPYPHFQQKGHSYTGKSFLPANRWS